MQRKSVAIRSLFAALMSLLAGCRGTPPEPPPPPHKGVGLRIACPDATTVAVLNAHGRVWAAHQHATVDVVSYKADQGPESASADVWVLRPVDLPRWAAAGRLAAVPDDLKRPEGTFRWFDLLPLYRQQLLRWGQPAYALPLLGESPLCCYRSDLFDDPVRRQGFRAFLEKHGRRLRDLKAPATWEELTDIAEFFAEQHPSGKPGPSLPPLPATDEGLDRLFYEMAAPFARRAVSEQEVRGKAHLDDAFSFHYDLSTGAPRIATPGFVHALTLLRRLQACRPPGPAIHPEEAFRTGQAVLCLTDVSALGKFQTAPGLRDKFGIVTVPGTAHYFTFAGVKETAKGEGNRVPYLGAAGWLMAVPQAEDKDKIAAAWHLLTTLSSVEVSGQIALEPRWGGGPIRHEQLRRERWDAFGLRPEPTADLKSVLSKTLGHELKNPVIALRTPEQAAHRTALLAEVRAALAGKKGPEEALREVARRWSELDAKKGLEAHKAAYRLSLGLLGR